MAVNSMNRILVIDDDRLFCDVVSDYLSGDSLEVRSVHTGAEGLSACSQTRMDVVLLDQHLPDALGHELCSSILQSNDQTKIIFITAHPSFEGALKAIRSGAHDYLSKPFEMEELSLTVRNALRTLELEKRAEIVDYRMRKDRDGNVLIGKSGQMADVFKLVSLAAEETAPVLITGETGTGKNVVARAIHDRSPLKNRAFISINCAAIPENLIEAELFGHEKGAFTGAATSRKGIFEMADGGTLFLDEIGEMPIHLQTKLLSVLEEKRLRRIGGESVLPVNVRIIAATSADIEKSLGSTFRNDLYYRLSVLRMHLPPLRERKEDISELCSYLLGEITHSRDSGLADEEISRLEAYDWPGNVRELKNVLERAVILQKGKQLTPADLLSMNCPAPLKNGCLPQDEIVTLEEMEKKHIMTALDRLSGNYARSARALGISLSTMKRKLKCYGLK